MLEMSNSDWKINLELLHAVKSMIEVKSRELFETDKEPKSSKNSKKGQKCKITYTWEELGFTSNEEPEKDIKEAGMLGLLILLHFIET